MISIEHDSGGVYIPLHRVLVSKTVQVSADPVVNLDYDMHGELVGIEIVP